MELFTFVIIGEHYGTHFIMKEYQDMNVFCWKTIYGETVSEELSWHTDKWIYKVNESYEQ